MTNGEHVMTVGFDRLQAPPDRAATLIAGAPVEDECHAGHDGRSARYSTPRPLPQSGSDTVRLSYSYRGDVANNDNKGWSLYGAPWSQPVATGRKWSGRRHAGRTDKAPKAGAPSGELLRDLCRMDRCLD
jgi:hypothetical protein